MGKPNDGCLFVTWEKDVKIIFCDLCLKEVDFGNRPMTHFNKENCHNIKEKFLGENEKNNAIRSN